LKNSYLKTPEANNTDLIRRELALAKVASSRAAVGDRQASHPCFFQTAFPSSLNFICYIYWSKSLQLFPMSPQT